MWHVSSRSGVATSRTAIHLLLTYLLTYYVALDVCQDGGDAARTVIRGRRVLRTHSSSIFRHLLEGNSFNVKVKAKDSAFCSKHGTPAFCTIREHRNAFRKRYSETDASVRSAAERLT